MDIYTLGVGIDPAKAVSGGKQAKDAADGMAVSFHKADDATKTLNNSLQQSPAKTDAFSRAMRAARAAVDAMTGGLRGIVGAITAVGAAFNFLTGAMVAIRAIMIPFTAAWNLMSGAINGAAEFEDYTIQFAQLLGSFEKADAKLKELADIANRTPFNLPEIVKGTVTLQSLSQGALTTRQNLMMIGDAVAKAKLPFDEMSITIGRLYANIKNGISSTFELNRLVETGVVTSNAIKIRSMMEKDNDAGKNAVKIWGMIEENLRNASGSMLLMSQTTNGLWSTLQDGWDTFQRTIGAALNQGIRPIIRTITEEIGTWTEKAKELAPQIERASIKFAAFVEVLRRPGGMKLAWDAGLEVLKDKLSRIMTATGAVLKAQFDIAMWEIKNGFTSVQKDAFWQNLFITFKNLAATFINALSVGIDKIVQKFTGQVSDNMLVKATTSTVGLFGFLKDYTETILEGGTQDEMNARMEQKVQKYATPSLPTGGAIMPMEAYVNPLFDTRPKAVGFGEAYDAAPQESTPMFSKLLDMMSTFVQKITDDNAQNRNNDLLAKPSGSKAATGAAVDGIEDSSKKAKKAADDMQQEAARFIKAVQTPLEVFEATMKRIAVHEKAGTLTAEEAGRARIKAQDDYQKALKKTEGQVESLGRLERSQFSQLMSAWGNMALMADQAATQIAHSIAQNISTGLTAMITGTKTAGEAFQQMAMSIVSELIRIMIQMLVMRAISAAAGGMFGGLLGGIAGAIMHTGGTVGEGGPSRATPASVFQNAPRYQHGGPIASGETPIVAEAGETVLTRQQASDIKGRLGKGGQEKQTTQVTVVNVLDPRMVEQEVAKNHSIVLNVIAQNAKTVKRMIG